MIKMVYKFSKFLDNRSNFFYKLFQNLVMLPSFNNFEHWESNPCFWNFWSFNAHENTLKALKLTISSQYGNLSSVAFFSYIHVHIVQNTYDRSRPKHTDSSLHTYLRLKIYIMRYHSLHKYMRICLFYLPTLHTKKYSSALIFAIFGS